MCVLDRRKCCERTSDYVAATSLILALEVRDYTICEQHCITVGGYTYGVAIGLSVTMTASVSGALLIGAEVLGLIAVTVMGKSGFAYIKTIFSVFSNNTAHPRR